MNESEEITINEIGGKIDVINSLLHALISCVCGTEELTQKDSINFAYLLESKISDLKNTHYKLIKELEI